MSDTSSSTPECEGGDPPCWSHLFDGTPGDGVDRDDVELPPGEPVDGA